MSEKLAEITAVTSGTQYRTGPEASWQTASQGQDLYEDYETRNTNQNSYTIELASEAEISFPDSIASIRFASITGEGRYIDENQKVKEVQSNTSVDAMDVYSAKNSLIPINVRGTRGMIKPKPWDDGP